MFAAITMTTAKGKCAVRASYGRHRAVGHIRRYWFRPRLPMGAHYPNI